MITVHDIAAAADGLRGIVDVTPCAHNVSFSRRFGADVYLKLESFHCTGSFKERGASTALSALSAADRARGVVTASAGNHAQAIAFHARRLGMKAKLVMPERTPLVKIQAVERLEGEVLLFGQTFDDAYAKALALADDEGYVFVSAFDNDRVITGQGTIGLELLAQVPELAMVVVPVGGGGLISGIATAIKAHRPDVRLIGVEAASYPGMRASLEAGAVTLVPGSPTLADGIAIKRVCERTLAYVQRYVDEVVTVSEEEIARAILVMLERSRLLAEGAAAAPLAALLTGQVETGGRPTVLVVSGGNIDTSRLDDIIARGLAADGRRVRLQAVMPDVPGQLHRLTGVVAEMDANVLDVVHDRAFGDAGLGKTEATLTLETRGREHIAKIIGALAAAGFEHVERVAPATRGGGVQPVPVY